jgi:hypothetical protein
MTATGVFIIRGRKSSTKEAAFHVTPISLAPQLLAALQYSIFQLCTVSEILHNHRSRRPPGPGHFLARRQRMPVNPSNHTYDLYVFLSVSLAMHYPMYIALTNQAPTRDSP